MKLVREYIIFEKFTEDSDPIQDMDIGIIPQIKKWMNERTVFSKSQYKILKNGTINIFKSFGMWDLKGFKLDELPEYIKFNILYGDFHFTQAKLTTLKGCPRIVKGSIYLGYNNLSSLKYGPEKVGVGYYCHNNKLKSLEGVAKVIGKTFECSGQTIQFVSKYLPEIVGEDFKHRLKIGDKPVSEELIRKYVNVKRNVEYRTH